MVDLFEEVEEQLRSDRYKTLARKVLPWVLGALAAGLLLALGVWGYQEYRQRADEGASEQYASALQAAGQGETEAAYKLFEEVAGSSSRAYRALALMHQAGIRADQGKRDEAVRLLDEAASGAPDEVIGDAARLKAIYLLMDSAPFSAIEARARPLTDDEGPYRLLAEEALAFGKLAAGDLAGARDDFAGLKDLFDAPEGVRQRATAAVELIDSGTAKTLPATLKAAAALPEPPAPAAGAASQAAPPPPAPGNP